MSRFTIREMHRVMCEQMDDAETITELLGPRAELSLLVLTNGEPQRARDLGNGIRIGLLLADHEAAATAAIAEALNDAGLA